MSSSSKRPRTNDSSSIDESLDNLEQLATALGQVGVHSISNAQFNRIANIACITKLNSRRHTESRCVVLQSFNSKCNRGTT